MLLLWEGGAAMKPANKRPLRLLRRVLPLAAGALLLRGLWMGGSLPTLSLAGRQEALAQAMLDTELGAYQGDESSLWERIVTAELPLYDGAEMSSGEEAAYPATDSVNTEESAETAESAEQADDLQTEEQTETDNAADDGSVVRQTITENANTVSGGGISLNNNTSGITVDPQTLAQSVLSQTIAPATEGPQILIMHTHGSEAYTMSGADVYTETDTARTDDENYNMIRVGEEMKEVFESMGFSVIHDTTLYDYPSYNGSYARSLAGIQSYLEQYPTIAVVLDVHRDALIAADGTVYKAVTQVDGEDTAQVMLVVGTDDGGLEHPNWQENLNLAAHIQLAMTAIEPTLARPINLRSQRFNQHLTPCSLLVEVGTSGNTLEEALRGARLFAQAAGEVYQSLLTG